MYILNLIGLVLGYLGSISLSVGFIKSKQEVIDEETPFWGPNPFKIRSTLRSRLLGFMGVAMLVAGFATSTVAMAFRNVFSIDSVLWAIVVIAALIVLAYLTITAALRAKRRAHMDAKGRYYLHELTDSVRSTKEEYEKDRLAATNGHTLDDIKKQFGHDFAQFTNNLNSDGKKSLGKLIGSIDKSEKLDDIMAALDDFLSEQEQPGGS